MDEQLQGVLAHVFGMRKADVHMGLTKEDVGKWDSLRQMDLVNTLETEYAVMLEIEDIVRMVSVDSIVAVLREKGVSLGD